MEAMKAMKKKDRHKKGYYEKYRRTAIRSIEGWGVRPTGKSHHPYNTPIPPQP